MELKYVSQSIGSDAALRSNRTFMELKSSESERLSLSDTVLIAPLWNWNKVISRSQVIILRRSNRTFMELKFHKRLRKTHIW